MTDFSISSAHVLQKGDGTRWIELRAGQAMVMTGVNKDGTPAEPMQLPSPPHDMLTVFCGLNMQGGAFRDPHKGDEWVMVFCIKDGSVVNIVAPATLTVTEIKQRWEATFEQRGGVRAHNP